MPRWKGTEYRSFLLYISIVVLKKHLKKYYYEHFLLFYCAVVILNSEYFVKYLIDTADEMIKSFLNIFKSKFGTSLFTSNLHNLCHLVDEVKRFGALQNFDAYPFKNRLQGIKKLVRQRRYPLSELAKRVLEQECTNERNINEFEQSIDTASLTRPTNFDCEKFMAIGNSYGVYEKIQFKQYRITGADRDKWFLTQNFEIVACKYIVSYFVGNQNHTSTYFFNLSFQVLHTIKSQMIYTKII